jgi:hypothetical protein
MNNKKIEETIAYCGLICTFCFQGKECMGCKSTNNLCVHDLSDEGCFQKRCCIKKSFDGCWQCSKLDSCEEGIYSLGNYSKIKAFAIYIKNYGKEYFIAQIVNNMKKGLSVEKGKDYDNKTIKEVLEIINGGNA